MILEIRVNIYEVGSKTKCIIFKIQKVEQIIKIKTA